ncbi:hypothetical protein HPB47_015446 [Ixodes persulcatus]|uniref:Uncharacterized protein n=1 Tax=Ixodes persulcatus TaxID=34615 RepID=A0AC60QW28_IXOPE|nr:hypothetical protein HPB47_015446 [Ixodes persulcatus]
MSVSYGYTYPPKPDHLPPLNLVEERLIAPRLPFMSIRRLTHGNGQYGIKGQVVNVPINVPTTVQCLPRNIPDDVAIDVHLKRRLVCKPSYKRGLVKKRNIHEWLKHLEHSPLYKYLKIKIDWRRLANVQDDGAVDDDEIEPAPEVTDLEDPMQAVIALNTMAHTLIFDDGACGVDTVAAITAARTAKRCQLLLPSTLTKNEVQKMIPQASMYLIKKSRKLMEKHGLWHEPDAYTRYKVSPENVSAALEYFTKDELRCSRQSPNEKDVISFRLDGEKTFVPKLFTTH